MRIHRFYIGSKFDLSHSMWVHDKELLFQWKKVLRFSEGQEVCLFDGQGEDRLYRITKVNDNEVHLELISQLKTSNPSKNVYLFWSLLKRANNEHVVQKCTEIGVSHFIPLISERTIKKDFNLERIQKIIIEASEQSGRSDIPRLREPIKLDKAISEYSDEVKLMVAEKTDQQFSSDAVLEKSSGVFIGPEGGWSLSELNVFKEHDIQRLGLGKFTLRAETAAVVASAKLIS